VICARSSVTINVVSQAVRSPAESVGEMCFGFASPAFIPLLVDVYFALQLKKQTRVHPLWTAYSCITLDD